MIGTSTDTGTATVGGVSKTFTLDKYVEEGDTAAPKLDEVTGLTSPNQRNVVHAHSQPDNAGTPGVDESQIRAFKVTTLPANTRTSIDYDGDFGAAPNNVYESSVHGDINDFDLGGTADTTPSQKVKSFDQWYNARFNFKDLASAMDGFWAPPRNYPLEVGDTKQDVMEGTVAALGFQGVEQPLNKDGSSVYRQASGATTIPVRLVLTDATGNPITPTTSPNAKITFSPQFVNNKESGTVLETADKSLVPTRGNLFKYNSQTGFWEYNWNLGAQSTFPALKTGTYYIMATLEDGGGSPPKLLVPPLANHNDPTIGPYTEKVTIRK
jgi:hypothetical protein